MSDPFIMLGFTSCTTVFVTMSQSVTIPTGFSFLMITMLPIFSSFIFLAISFTESSGWQDTTVLFIISLTRTLVVILASRCLLMESLSATTDEDYDLLNYFARN